MLQPIYKSRYNLYYTAIMNNVLNVDNVITDTKLITMPSYYYK